MTLKENSYIKETQRYKSVCAKGDCPSLAEIKNNKIRELAKRLRASSARETLTNISEWQNDNMTYWFERNPLLNYISQCLVASFIIIVILGIFSFLSTAFPVGGITLTTATFFSILSWVLIISMTAVVTLLIVMVGMITYYRKTPLSEVLNVFYWSISIDFLLKRKLAVCRDYAKLSAAILFNIFPDKDIYFVYAPHHVATGILIEDNLYILDKYLPVTTFSRWNDKWNRGKFSSKNVKRAKDGKMFLFEDSDNVFPKTSQNEQNLKMFSSRLEQKLGIQSPRDNSSTTPIQLLEFEKGKKLYEDDEVVNYSIARRLEAIMLRERLKTSQIAHLKIKEEKDDFIFLAYLKCD